MSKKIFYIQQQVELNQVIDFNGLKVKVTQELIDNNPNHFYIKDDRIGVLKAHFSKAVQNYSRVYDCNEVNPIQQCFTRLFDKHNRVIPEYVKCIDADCNLELNNIYRVDKAKYTVSGNHTTTLNIWFQDQPNPFMFDNVTQFFKHFTPSTEVEYKQQDNKTFPKYVKCINNYFPAPLELDKIYRVTEYLCGDISIVINDDTTYFLSFNRLQEYFTPSTEEEYKQQEETKRLDNLLNEIKAKFPIGSKMRILVDTHYYKITNERYPSYPLYEIDKNYISVFAERINNTQYTMYCKVYDLNTNEYLALPYTIEDERLDHAKKKYANVHTLELLSKTRIVINDDNTISFEENTNGDIFIRIQPNDRYIENNYIYCIYHNDSNRWAKIIN